MSGLDAIIVALAPAFAAGFAIQKLLETCDALFSRLAAEMAEEVNKYERLKSKKVEEATTALNDAKNELKPEQKSNAKVEKAEKSLLEEEKEFEKSLKVLLTGVAAILIGIWIVS